MSRAVTRPPTVGLVLRVRIGEAVADVELLQERSTGWAPGLGGAETPSGEPGGAPDLLPLPDRVRPPARNHLGLCWRRVKARFSVFFIVCPHFSHSQVNTGARSPTRFGTITSSDSHLTRSSR